MSYLEEDLSYIKTPLKLEFFIFVLILLDQID